MTSHMSPDERLSPAHWLEARVGSGYTIVSTSDDASFRRYFRVAGPDGTFMLMDAPPAQEDCRPFVRVAGLLRQAGVHAPEIRAEDVASGYLLLEDFGDTTYLAALDSGTDAGPLYAAALDSLVRMQRIELPAWLPPYNESALRAELALFPEWFLERHLGIQPPEWLPGIERTLVDAALEQPRVFVHRDYHSRNLMVIGGEAPGVIDFQDAVAGPVSYDLVSLLRDAYIEWPAERVNEWIDDYRQQAGAAGIDCGTDLATFVRWFDLTGLQRQLKVAGIFARLHHRDGKPGYLENIPLTLRYAAVAAGRYDETSRLARWLESEILPTLETGS